MNNIILGHGPVLRGAIVKVLSLTLALFVVLGSAPLLIVPAKAAAVEGDVAAFCQSNPNEDFPDALYFGSHHAPDAVPPQIARLDAGLKWRCMAGKVLVCQDSADGDWCGKKDASRTPSALLRQGCKEEPNKREFDFAESHYSAFDWTCKKGVPVIARSYALDARDFFKTSWRPLVLRNGRAVGPTDFPDGPR